MAYTFGEKSSAMTPTKAWLKSLPTAIAGPIAGWLLYAASGVIWDKTGTGIGSLLSLGLIAGIVGGLIHLPSYAVVGLPLFHHGYANQHSPIWSLGISVTIGLGSGLFAFLVLQILIRGGSLSHMNPWILIVGPLYGLWTSLCARRFGPTNSQSGAGE